MSHARTVVIIRNGRNKIKTHMCSIHHGMCIILEVSYVSFVRFGTTDGALTCTDLIAGLVIVNDQEGDSLKGGPKI